VSFIRLVILMVWKEQGDPTSSFCLQRFEDRQFIVFKAVYSSAH